MTSSTSQPLSDKNPNTIVNGNGNVATPHRKKMRENNPISPTGQLRSPSWVRSGNTGIHQAKLLVHAILNQVAFDDSPPLHDDIHDNAIGNPMTAVKAPPTAPKERGTNSVSNTTIASKSQASGTPMHHNFSRQHHVQVGVEKGSGMKMVEPSPTAADLGDSMPFLFSPSFANPSLDLDLNPNPSRSTSASQSQSQSTPIRNSKLPKSVSIQTPQDLDEALPMPPPITRPTIRLGQGPEAVMGNVSLAALCARTIESIDVEVIDFNLKAAAAAFQADIHAVHGNQGYDVDVERVERVESQEDMTRWQKEVEMAPTFASDENEKKDTGGPSTRKAFLFALDESGDRDRSANDLSNDRLLFPGAVSMSVDDSDFNPGMLDDCMNAIMEEDEETDDVLDLIPANSKEDGVVLSSVAEGNEEHVGQAHDLNVTMPTSNTTSSNQTNVYEPSPLHIDPGEIPMSSSLEFSTSAATRSPKSALSPESAAANTRLTMSPERPSSKPRMQMFGSEYARHLCSESIFSPPVRKVKSRSFPKMLKKKKNASTIAAAATKNSPTRSGTVSVSAYESGSVSAMSGMAGSHSHQHGNSRTQDPVRFTAGSVSTMSNTSASLHSGARGISLEEAPPDIIGAAITDVVVTHGSEKPPKGYYRISQTSNGTALETLKISNSGGIGKRKFSGVYLNVKKEQKWDRAVQRPCVTALAVIFPDRNEFVPPGFCVVRRYKAPSRSDRKSNNSDDSKYDKSIKEEDAGSLNTSFPANLNYGTSGERVYLCYRRSREGNPVTGMIPLQPSNNEPVPEGYTVLERSPRNFVADINSKAGPPVFLSFRQRLANLETLRPLPLVLSVHYSNGNYQNVSQSPGGKKKRMRLKAYYCTGGTVVPSDIGKYHIMDRSTHPLISPSSVTNRLSLIQASRNKNSNTNGNGNSTTGKSTRSDRSPSPTTLANGLVAVSPSSGASLQFSHSYDKSVNPADGETDSSVQSEGITQPQQQKESSLVDNILHLVNQISPGSKQKNDAQDKSKSLLVGDMETDAASAVDASAVVDASAADAEDNNEHDDGHSVASSAQSSLFAARDDSNLAACFEAMDFIPLVQCPYNTLGQIDKGTLETLLQARIAVLTPILTACYTHHGGSALLAVEGLTKLLNETDFFMPDVALFDDPNVNQRLTLLDLSIQVVCDVANSTARETNFLPCIEFVVEATNYAKGNLNARTIGYIIRFYLFVFYFGASVPTASSWPKSKTSGYSRKEGLDEANDTMLLSEDELNDRRAGYVPGGAPQAAALALKELISIFLSRLRKMKMGGRKQVAKSGDAFEKIDGFITHYVDSLIDGAVHQVDVSNYTEMALHQIHRSGGSELFWHDMMTSCGLGLFGQDSTIVPAAKDYYVTSFAILSSVVKITSGKVRRLAQSSEFVPRDIASKLLSLELMHHFLHQWGKTCKYNNALEKMAVKEGRQIEDSSSLATMAYTIRRLIIPCLLSNTRSGLDDIKVFRRMMKIVTELWCNRLLRRHIKIEIGVLIEHFVLKFLRLGPQVLPPKRLSKTSSSALNDMTVSLLPQQVCIVTEMKSWFISEPRDILELFMNFDQVDAQSSKTHFSLLPSTHWKITQQMCGALCTLAEQCTDIVSDQIRLTRIDLAEVDSQSAGVNPALHHTEEDLREMTLVREGARYLQGKCFDTIAQIVRSLMLCAAASSGANYNLLSKLREKQEKDLARKEAAENLMKAAHANGDDEDSSRDSAGSMTVKSISTIGNIVGGIMNKKKDSSQTNEIMKIPESPRHQRQVPQLTLGDDDGDGIVEYWQTSIAAERRKNTQPSPRDPQDTQKKPPRGLRISRKSTPSTPTRLSASSNFRGTSPLTAKSPRRDDASVVSFAEDSIRGDPHLSEKLEETLDTAFEIMKTKSLKKALDFLIACNILTPSPRDIASFLRLYQARIDTSMLGDYLGDGGKDGDEVEHYNLIRFHYTCAISFVGMNVEQG